MLTQVAVSSLAAHRHLTRSGEQQRTAQQVAEVILAETRAGRSVNIAIVQWLISAKTGGFWEKSTVSARMNDLKKSGISIKGRDYEMKFVGMWPCPINKKKQMTRMYWLVPAGHN